MSKEKIKFDDDGFIKLISIIQRKKWYTIFVYPPINMDVFINSNVILKSTSRNPFTTNRILLKDEKFDLNNIEEMEIEQLTPDINVETRKGKIKDIKNKDIKDEFINKIKRAIIEYRL